MYGGPILTRKRRCCMCNKVMSQVQMARAAAVAVASCPDARDCPMCDYVATARSSLIIHMRKHTGERPYRCHLCPAAFAKSSDRSRHFRTHQLHKPFNCGSCGKSFAQRRRDLQSWTCRHASTPRLAPDTSASCVTLPRRSLTTYVLTCTHITLGRPASMPSLDNIGSAWSAATSRSAKEDWCQGHITVHHPGKDALVQAVQICYDQLPQHGVAPAESRKQETIPVSPLSTSL
ncbi:zinc finger and BTB domain-containing protein 7B-like isoform X6 [Dermacentor albipictus]|uniref:zinc finger and BTB domain-containing protein 7B-like isoform X6 n=1 Tax=Dermacentor albipictus TaxID=60249 RepID=UPI0038FC7E4F